MAEREWKLTPRPGYIRPRLDDAAPGLTSRSAGELDQHTAWLDTPDLRLARGGASIRYRNGEGWTVKLPLADADGALVRDERVFNGAPGTPPGPALDLLRAWVRTARVDVVARARTARRRVEVLDGAGRIVCEVADDDVEVHRPGHAPFRFRQLEVEEREGPVEAIDAVVARLRAAGAVDGQTPKIVLALGEDARRPPEPAPVEPLPADATVAAAVRTALAASVHRLLAHDAGVRLAEDAEHVHQARVATRRLRSDLRTFAPVLDPRWSEPLRAELRWLGGELGPVRDTDVLLELLADRAARLTVADRKKVEPILALLARDNDDARVELLVAMRSPRYAALLDRLVDAADHPRVAPELAAEPASEVLPRLVKRPWRKAKRAAAALGPDSPDAALHDLRIRAKRARYAAEAVTPVVGADAAAFARAMAKVQSVLGDHHDAVVAGAWLRGTLLRHDEEETVFAAGALAGLLRADELRLRDEWPAVWRTAARHRLRTWL